jgi:hypothetical protein
MAMRFIPTRVHAVVDYVTGPTLVALPALLGFGGAPAVALRAAGGGVLAQSALTRYELGLVRVVPMPVHLAIDAATGAALAAVGGFAARDARSRAAAIGAGVMEIAAALTTQTSPPKRKWLPWR